VFADANTPSCSSFFKKMFHMELFHAKKCGIMESYPLVVNDLPAVFRGVRTACRVASSSLVSSLTRNEKGPIETLQEHHNDASLNNIPSFSDR